MAKKGQISVFQLQKSNKPLIEDLSNSLLEGDIRDNFFVFLSFLKELKMKPCWYAISSYNLSYQGKKVGLISIGKGDKFIKNYLQIMIFTSEMNDLDRFFQDETDQTRNEFKNNIKYCAHCASCAPGVSFTFCGDLYEHVCFKGYNLIYINPTLKDYNRIKQYINLRRNYIKEVLKKQP